MNKPSQAALIGQMKALIDNCLNGYITGAPISIVDFPDIRNCGDSAIWIGEIAYLRDRHRRQPSYVSRMHDFSAEELEKTAPEGPIFIHGGGNFGDIWPSHQDFREHIISRFPSRRIIQFPQSIHYSAPERADATARVISRHKDFVLLVRDEESREFAQKKFDCKIQLCPDMAFCIGPVTPLQHPQLPVLAMLRQDKEQGGAVDLTAYGDIPVEDWITENPSTVRFAKAMGTASALLSLDPAKMRFAKLDAAAHARLERGLRQLSRAQAIVTDRLHVHICSLLLGKPHAVLDNNYGKVRRFMRAFSGGTELSYMASSFDDAVAWARGQAASRSSPHLVA